MRTNECSQPAFKSSWDSQDFGDVSMVLKMAHFRKSTRPQWVKAWLLHSGWRPGIARRKDPSVVISGVQTWIPDAILMIFQET